MENYNRSFEERKREHLETLKDDVKSLTILTLGAPFDDVAKDMLKIITNPKDDRELKIAKITWSITKDTILLKEDIELNRAKPLPVRESAYFGALIDIINCLKEDDLEKAYEVRNEVFLKQGGKLAYEMLVKQDRRYLQEAFGYVAMKCGYNIVSEEEGKELVDYVTRAKEIMSDNNDDYTKKSPYDYDDYDIEKASNVATGLHEIVSKIKRDNIVTEIYNRIKDLFDGPKQK